MSCYAATASDYTQWCLLTLSNYVMFWHGNNAMLWIINDNIEFNPEMNRPASLSRPDLNIILTTPASRCLRLLLENALRRLTTNILSKSVGRRRHGGVGKYALSEYLHYSPRITYRWRK